jgi:hypothetical protein
VISPQAMPGNPASWSALTAANILIWLGRQDYSPHP